MIPIATGSSFNVIVSRHKKKTKKKKKNVIVSLVHEATLRFGSKSVRRASHPLLVQTQQGKQNQPVSHQKFQSTSPNSQVHAFPILHLYYLYFHFGVLPALKIVSNSIFIVCVFPV